MTSSSKAKERFTRENYFLSSIIGDALRVIRKSKKLTTAEVSNRTGYSAQAISLIERAKRMPSSDLLIKLSGVYEVDLEELIRLREQTIYETVQVYGEKAPASIRNEFNLLENSKFNVNKNIVNSKQEQKDFLSLGNGEFATEEELAQAKAIILALRSVKKD